MTLTYKHCEFYNKGNCDLEYMRWGYQYPCNKKNYCIDKKIKRGYENKG